MINKKRQSSLPEKLYIGTLDSAAKKMPIFNIPPPIILTNVYAPHFAYYTHLENSNPSLKWSIVEVETKNINPQFLYPFHGFIEKTTRNKSGVKNIEGIVKRRKDLFKEVFNSRVGWVTSFEACGCIIYNNTISEKDISKIVTFDPSVRGANPFVLSSIATFYNPWEVNKKEHTNFYGCNKEITDWFLCKEIKKDWSYNREGLDIFYTRKDK